MKLTGLVRILRRFDAFAWKGHARCGEWEIANGGYDCWFEVCYRGIPVIDCIAGNLSVIATSGDPDTDAVIKEAISVIRAEYPHLKLVTVETEKGVIEE